MKLISGIATAAVVSASLMFSQATLADGSALFKSKGCAGCHGADAMGMIGPRLAGQVEAYINEQFKLIRDGKRASGKAPIMSGAVKAVKDEEVAEIAKYLHGLK